MKKLVLVAAAAFMAVPAFAAINPLDPGLPNSWTATAAKGYSALVIDGTPKLTTADSMASVMCVECHTVNPSALIAAPIEGQATGPVTNGALYQGTHYVINSTIAAGDAFGKGNSGGGFTGGFGATQPRIGGQYEKLTAWTDSGALSKYGNGTAYTSVTGGSATDKDMICESCHNVLMNTGDQLTVETLVHTATAGGDDMCVGCHSEGGPTSDYAGFQVNGNLKNFNGLRLKRHHVLQGETLNTAAGGPYNPDNNVATNDSIMWAPAYSMELGDTGKFDTWVYRATIADGAAFAFRNRWNISGAGTQELPDTTGDIGTANMLYCTSCHRPHNAMTKAGAFILRTGTGGDFSSAIANGIERQYEAGSYATDKIYGDYVTLCAGCHTGYDL